MKAAPPRRNPERREDIKTIEQRQRYKSPGELGFARQDNLFTPKALAEADAKDNSHCENQKNLPSRSMVAHTRSVLQRVTKLPATALKREHDCRFTSEPKPVP
jgi:hypothetical protein